MAEAEKRVKRFIPQRETAGRVAGVIKEICRKEEVSEQVVRCGGQRRKVSLFRSKGASVFPREYGVSFAEIARQLGVSTSAIAKAVGQYQ